MFVYGLLQFLLMLFFMEGHIENKILS